MCGRHPCDDRALDGNDVDLRSAIVAREEQVGHALMNAGEAALCSSYGVVGERLIESRLRPVLPGPLGVDEQGLLAMVLQVGLELEILLFVEADVLLQRGDESLLDRLIRFVHQALRVRGEHAQYSLTPL